VSTAQRSSKLRFLGQRRFWNRLERGLLSAGLTLVALVADWLLARRLAHDREQTADRSTPVPGQR
jgi:hypothetical protein